MTEKKTLVPTIKHDKHCLVYCGDQCDCERGNPSYGVVRGGEKIVVEGPLKIGSPTLHCQEGYCPFPHETPADCAGGPDCWLRKAQYGEKEDGEV